MFAAWAKAFNRCWPSVVPVLPPTGAAGVGSLNPTPGSLMLTITIVAAAEARPAASVKQAATAARAILAALPWFIGLSFIAVSPRYRRRCCGRLGSRQILRGI